MTKESRQALPGILESIPEEEAIKQQIHLLFAGTVIAGMTLLVLLATSLLWGLLTGVISP